MPWQLLNFRLWGMQNAPEKKHVTITYHRTNDGAQVAEVEALDEYGILRPGFAMRTHAMLMDEHDDGDELLMFHINDGRSVADEQKEARIDAYRARIANAWRDPGAQFRADANAAKLRDDALAKVSDPYVRRDHWLKNAWR